MITPPGLFGSVLERLLAAALVFLVPISAGCHGAHFGAAFLLDDTRWQLRLFFVAITAGVFFLAGQRIVTEFIEAVIRIRYDGWTPR